MVGPLIQSRQNQGNHYWSPAATIDIARDSRTQSNFEDKVTSTACLLFPERDICSPRQGLCQQAAQVWVQRQAGVCSVGAGLPRFLRGVFKLTLAFAFTPAVLLSLLGRKHFQWYPLSRKLRASRPSPIPVSSQSDSSSNSSIHQQHDRRARSHTSWLTWWNKNSSYNLSVTAR